MELAYFVRHYYQAFIRFPFSGFADGVLLHYIVHERPHSGLIAQRAGQNLKKNRVAVVIIVETSSGLDPILFIFKNKSMT